MTFNDYIQALPIKKNNVKYKIIERLWREGTSFPRGWVSSKELLSLTQQKYFDRRIRELRDENGCDIESITQNGEHGYQLLSTTINASNQRLYLSDVEKARLFQRAQNRCAICNKQYQAGIRGLQADHKIPLKRGGSHEIANWQPLCVECNVGKRSTCSDCTLDCRSCSWAFPEQIGHRLVINIPYTVEQTLVKYTIATQKTIDQCVADAIVFYIAQNTR